MIQKVLTSFRSSFAVLLVIILAACGSPADGEHPGVFTLHTAEAYCTPESTPAVELRWNSSTTAATYEVHRDGAHYETLDALTLQFDDTTNVTAGQTYDYTIHARNNSGITSTPAKSVTVSADICSVLPGPGGLSERTVISGGGSHSLALHEDGTVWAWGYNLYGQLGDGTTTTRRVPVQVSTLTNITSINAGDVHSLALREDGTVWAWGHNANGQLGDGTQTARYTPVKVPNLTNITSINAEGVSSLALSEDGTVWAWGNNGSGELGDGTTTDRHTPVQVTNLTNITSINAGANHSLALHEDGTVWAWGRNANGQLGDDTTTERHTPVQVIGLTGVHY